MNRLSTTLFGLVLTFALCLSGWWVLFETRQARDLEQAGVHLQNGAPEAAAQALGATDGKALQALARRRHTMFASEGLAFVAVLLLAGGLFFVALRREARLRKNHDRFLAGATHELKTPLATIRLLLESLRDDRLPQAKRARYFGSGLLELERLERGLTNLLTVAGLRSAGRAVHRETGDLATDTRTAIEAMTTRAEAATVTLHANGLPSLACRRDPDAIQLIVRNLLDNAVKYSPAAGTVAVDLRRDGEHAVLTVTDQGRGMTADELAQAFQPFFRGGGQSVGGAGLGLFLVHELVAAHGGAVAIHSDGPGRGSRVAVRLPLAKGAG